MSMTDQQLIYRSLMMWKNYIETGDICMSRNDAVASGQTHKVKQLDPEQESFTHRLQRLADGTIRESL